MLIKLTITQLLIGLLEKFFRLYDPQTPLYQENITISYFRSNGLITMYIKYDKSHQCTSSNKQMIDHRFVCLPVNETTVYISLATGVRGVLGVGSIPVAMLPSCQDMKINLS